MHPAHLTVNDAADALGLHPRRVRALIASGSLAAEKLGGRWLLDAADVARANGAERPPGRPLSPSRAWAILSLIEGGTPGWLSAHEIARTRSYLRRAEPAGLLPRLSRRAPVRTFRAHPADLPRLVRERAVVLSGPSAASHHGASIAAPGTVEGYVSEVRLGELVERYHLAASPNPNVRLHVLGPGLWPFEDARVAPAAVVALDLLEADDERSRRAGRELLAGLGLVVR
jgi:excisionase family DNA binding protein